MKGKDRFRDYAGLILGRNCLVCGSQSYEDLCPDCKAILDVECFDSYMVRCPKCFFPLVSHDYNCPRCGRGQGSTLPSNALKVQTHSENAIPIHSLPLRTIPIYAVADYNSNLSYSLLHRLKFLGDRKVAKIAAMYLQRAIDTLDPKGEALVVPVPCSAKSLRERGWDQMVEVCRYIDRPMLGILENTQDDQGQQKLLDRSQRLEKRHEKRFSKASAYEGRESGYLGRPVVMVDDVATTFSTVLAASDCLFEMGFDDVKAAVWLYDYKA